MVATAVVAMWIRRWTFKVPWERPITSNIIILTGSAITLSPSALALIGPTPYNIDRITAHCLGLVGIAVALYAFLSFLGDEGSIQHFYTRWVTYPMTVGVAVIVALYAQSSAAHADYVGIADAPRDIWVHGSLTVLITLKVLLLGICGRALLILRSERRTNTIDLFLVWVSCGLVGAALQAVAAIFVVQVFPLVWISMAVGSAAWSVAAAIGWRRRSRPLVLPLCNLIPAPQGELCGQCPLVAHCPYDADDRTWGVQ